MRGGICLFFVVVVCFVILVIQFLAPNDGSLRRSRGPQVALRPPAMRLLLRARPLSKAEPTVEDKNTPLFSRGPPFWGKSTSHIFRNKKGSFFSHHSVSASGARPEGSFEKGQDCALYLLPPSRSHTHTHTP